MRDDWDRENVDVLWIRWVLSVAFSVFYKINLHFNMNTFAIVRNTVNILKIDWELDFLKVDKK